MHNVHKKSSNTKKANYEFFVKKNPCFLAFFTDFYADIPVISASFTDFC